MDRVKSGSYFIALSVLVFGITTFAGFAGSFGCTGGLASNGFVAVFVFSVVGALTAGFCTGSAVAVFFCIAGIFAGAAFFTSSFLGAGFAGAGAFAIGLTDTLAAGWVFEGVEAFAAFAGRLLDTDLTGAEVDLTAFLGGADLLVALAAGLAGDFFAGWAALPDFLVATFLVAIRFLPFF
jgi:hypothetical protein